MRGDETATLYERRDAEALRALQRHEPVEYEGATYRIRLSALEDCWILVSAIRLACFGLGGMLGLAGLYSVVRTDGETETA